MNKLTSRDREEIALLMYCDFLDFLIEDLKQPVILHPLGTKFCQPVIVGPESGYIYYDNNNSLWDDIKDFFRF